MLGNYETVLQAEHETAARSRRRERRNPCRSRRSISRSSTTTSARSTTLRCCTSLRSCWACCRGSAGRSRCGAARSGCCGSHSRCTRSRWSPASTFPAGRRSRICTRRPFSSAGPACCWRSLFESIYRLGLGNIVASVIGFLTLLVAYNLSLDGDTFIVLQAVLDTQFWLATHVVTINFGYATTYRGRRCGAPCTSCWPTCFRCSIDDARRKLLRMLYGTLCFAIFFSFVGTVLGGLWADDSWGRFWGWDPKENGALMIVLWNALVLHARWGGLVKGRGLATLAIGGNIVTTWSWFGVNELGVGLHAYGASEKQHRHVAVDLRRLAAGADRARHDAAALVRIARLARSDVTAV